MLTIHPVPVQAGYKSDIGRYLVYIFIRLSCRGQPRGPGTSCTTIFHMHQFCLNMTNLHGFRGLNRSRVLAGANFIASRRHASYYMTRRALCLYSNTPSAGIVGTIGVAKTPAQMTFNRETLTIHQIPVQARYKSDFNGYFFYILSGYHVQVNRERRERVGHRFFMCTNFA